MLANCVTESFDIHSVGCILFVKYPKLLNVDWDTVCRSIPRGRRGNCRCNQWAHLEIRIDDTLHPNIKDNPAQRRTVVTVSKTGISANDLRRLVNALIQRCHLSKGLISVHSVIVGLEGKAIALLGGFGDGKTVTSLRMIEDGAKLIACDIGLLEVHVPGKRTIVVGGSRSIMIRPVLLRRYFRYWYEQLIQKEGSLNREKVDVSEFVKSLTDHENGAYELIGLAYVKVSPVNENDQVYERIQKMSTEWPAMQQFSF